MANFPYRRGSGSSEKDFFDIEDEPISHIVKRQLRRPRTWITFLVFFLLLKWYNRAPPPALVSHVDFNKVDWSRYAYSTYATSETHLCNCLMVFEALHRLGSRAERVLLYPQQWDLIIQNEADRTSQLLIMAKDNYNVELRPIEIEGMNMPAEDARGSSEASWDTSAAKLSAFGLLQYERVIHLDADMTLLQHMDELFFLPKATIAMPRAYWLLPESRTLSSLIAVIEPSFREWNILREVSKPAIYGQVDFNQNQTRYDMELLNARYGDSAMVLPHQEYGLISGEFRTKDHHKFLGNMEDEWNPDKVMKEAKFVHFSDWPLPKPWVMWPQKQLAEVMPACDNNPGTPDESGCRDREVWKHIYEDFRLRRKDICRLLSFPAPV